MRWILGYKSIGMRIVIAIYDAYPQCPIGEVSAYVVGAIINVAVYLAIGTIVALLL